MQRLMVIIHLK